jgi:hypothetical protein
MTRQTSRRNNIAAIEAYYRSQCVQARLGVSHVNSKIAALQPLQVLSLTRSPLASSWARSSISSNSILESGTQAR